MLSKEPPRISEKVKDEYEKDPTIVTNYVHPHSIYSRSMPLEPIAPPRLGQAVELDSQPLDPAVVKSFPIAGTEVIANYPYGSSMWARTAKLVVKLPNGTELNYFLKIIPSENPGRVMCQGEYESLKEIHQFVPKFVPEVFGWGPLSKSIGYFLLAEFREVGQQPADPNQLGMHLAELHRLSKSPTGKFGFHTVTCHGNLPQDVNCWESSWTAMFTRLLRRAMELDDAKHVDSPEYAPIFPEYNAVRNLLFDKVIPRLLDPLQSEGRVLKPCLVHGDVWDENCADDMITGEPFTFDAGSFYAHNEYELGFWRPPRFRLSSPKYARAYKKHFPMSEPVEDWDDRNLLYSIRLNVSCSTLIPASGQRTIVLEDMKILCGRHFPRELKDIEAKYNPSNESSPERVVYDEEEDEEEDLEWEKS